jgi:3-oxoacyl-[acyl-carrier protein] reductase
VDFGLSGKRAAVAGASAGLGLGVARALVAEGVHVAICGRDRERIDAAARELGGDTVALVVDVGDAEGGRRFVAEARAALGGVDILVANAGGPPAGTVAQTPLERYDAALQLSLMSTIAMCYEAVDDMIGRGWGRIVAITSVSARQPIPNLVLSNTARAGLTGFLKTLATEVAAHGVTVNSVQPGLHATQRLRQLRGDLIAAGRETPMGVLGDPDDFGRVVAFLCSTAARFLTGVALPVDGGASSALQ